MNKHQNQEWLILASRYALLEKLEHFSLYSNRLILLSGESGSGKSILLKQLAASLGNSIDVVEASCDDPAWFSDVLKQVNISSSAGAMSFQFGLGQIHLDQDTLFLLDNADELTIEQLDLLVQKVDEEHFHCIVSVDRNSSFLTWAKEFPESIVTLIVPPLNDDEARQLISFFIDIDERKLESLIDDESLAELLSDAQGNVQWLEKAAFTIGKPKVDFTNQLEETSGVANWLKLSAMSFIAIVLIMALIYQDQINQIFTSEPKQSILVPQKSNDAPAETVQKEQPHEQVKNQTINNKKLSNEETIITEPKSKSDNSEKMEEQVTQLTNVTNSVENKDNNNSEAWIEESKAESNDLEFGENVLSSNVEQTTDIMDQIENSLDTQIEQEISAASSEDVFPIQSEPVKATLPSTKPFNAEEKYLLKTNEDAWAIQLSGFGQLENAADFIEQNRNAGELHFYRTTRQSKDWYVVIMGPFANKDVATAKREQLPTALKSKRPWLKSFDKVHSEIKNR